MNACECKNYVKQTALACTAMCFQLIACMHFRTANIYLKISGENVGNLFLDVLLDKKPWAVVSFLGRILGVLILGKYAHKYGIFKTMHLVCSAFVALSIALVISLEIVRDGSHEKLQLFYFMRFIYSFLQPSAVILPAIYLLRISPPSSHLAISAAIGIAITFKIIIDHHIGQISSFNIAWFFIPVITTSIAWGMYFLMQETSTSLKYVKKNHPIRLNTKILSIILGAGSSSVAYYNRIFLAPYLKHVHILDPDKIMSKTAYLCLFAILLFPCAKLSKRLGFHKISLLSLAGLFVLTFKSSIFIYSPAIYLFHQIIFAIFSALFVGPLFAILFRMFKPHPMPYQEAFWAVLGFSGCVSLAVLEKQIGLDHGISNLGWCVFNLCIATCFVGILRYGKIMEGSQAFHKRLLEKTRLNQKTRAAAA